jgi:hypothetical protein
MLYQTHAIFADKRPVTCKLLNNFENLWEVEYNDGTKIVTTKVHPKELTTLDYCEGEISQ